MPRKDGTGPMSGGPMTGRGMGICTGANVYGVDMGAGCRRGFGRGFGGFYVNQDLGKTNKEVLQTQKKFMQDRLEMIEKQLESL